MTSRVSRARLLLLLTGISLGSASSSFADVCAPEPTSWAICGSISVWIHKDLAANLERSNGVQWTLTELRRELEGTTLSFEEGLGVGIPTIKVETGTWSGDWAHKPGACNILVSPYLAPDCAVTEVASYTGSPTDGGLMVFVRSGPGFKDGVNQGLLDCNLFWKHFDPPPNPSRVFRGVFNHELMHAFGNKHGPNCPSLYCPADSQGYDCSCGGTQGTDVQTAWNCHKHDQDVLSAAHGDWGTVPETLRHRESFNGLAWSNLSAPPWHAPLPGLSNSSLPYLFMARRVPNYVNTYVQLYRWTYTTQAWDYWGYVQGSTVTALGSVDVEYAGPTVYPHIVSAGVASAEDPLREIYFTKMTAPSTRLRWSLGTDLTTIDGAAIAYEQASQRFIVVWRDDHLGINLQTATTSGVFGPVYELTDSSDIRQIGAEAPTIACAPSSVGAHPCIVAWAVPIREGTNDYQALRWVHIGIDGSGNFTKGNILQQGWVLQGPPHVAYLGPDTSSTAFLMTQRRNSPSLYYTVGKGVGETASWGNQTTHSLLNYEFGFSPAIGTAGGAYELVEQSRYP